jgi:hypothetical protein
VINTVVPHDGFVIGGVHTFDPTHVDPVFVRIGPALMVRINPAGLTEMVLGGARPEGIKRQVIGALHNLKIAYIHSHGSHSAAAAERTIAAACGVQPVGQRQIEFNSAQWQVTLVIGSS